MKKNKTTCLYIIILLIVYFNIDICNGAIYYYFSDTYNNVSSLTPFAIEPLPAVNQHDTDFFQMASSPTTTNIFNANQDNYVDCFVKLDNSINGRLSNNRLLITSVLHDIKLQSTGNYLFCTKLRYEIYDNAGNLVWPITPSDYKILQYSENQLTANDIVPTGVFKSTSAVPYYIMRLIYVDNPSTTLPYVYGAFALHFNYITDTLDQSGVMNSNDNLANAVSLDNEFGGGSGVVKNELWWPQEIYQNTINATLENFETSTLNTLSEKTKGCGGTYWYKFQSFPAIAEYYINTIHSLSGVDTKINIYRCPSTVSGTVQFSDLIFLTGTNAGTSGPSIAIGANTKYPYAQDDIIYIQVSSNGNPGPFFLNVRPFIPNISNLQVYFSCTTGTEGTPVCKYCSLPSDDGPYTWFGFHIPNASSVSNLACYYESNTQGAQGYVTQNHYDESFFTGQHPLTSLSSSGDCYPKNDNFGTCISPDGTLPAGSPGQTFYVFVVLSFTEETGINAIDSDVQLLPVHY